MRTLLCLALAAAAIHAEAIQGDAASARAQSPLLREGTRITLEPQIIKVQRPTFGAEFIPPTSFAQDMSQISLQRDLLPLASENLVREALETHNQENR